MASPLQDDDPSVSRMRSAMLNLLEDLNEEKADLAETHQATLNILEDFDEERAMLGAGVSAVFNILEDFHAENASLQDGQRAMLNILEDLDDARAKAEETGAALARANARRAEIAEAHAAELKHINDGLATASRELETFSYSVSHDLRAPLRAIDGFSRILLEDYADQLDVEGRRVLGVVCDSATKMSRLIDDILAFSRVGRLDMDTVSVNMNMLIDNLLSGALAPGLTGREVEIAVAPLPRVRGDATLLQHVWMNLIDNAIKFTSAKPGARIDIGAEEADGETVFRVRDNGAGFDMQYYGKLFGVFQRLHGTEFPGTGIGLAIVRRIVDRHGGRVWAEGQPGEGATFYFSLPSRSLPHD